MKKNVQVYIQIVLWLIYAILLTLLINERFSTSDSIIKASVLVAIQISLFYTNSQILFPKLLVNKKVWKYILQISIILFILLLFFLWFEKQFFPDTINAIRERPPNRGLERPFRAIAQRKQFVNALVLFDFLSLLIVLILSTAYAAAQISRKKELIDSEKSREDLVSEMNFLKSQINPHFLFNALNNIYSLTLTGSEKASDMILKLSAMLRYILYDCNVSFVVIEKEWDYILNFIDFQKLKSKENLQLTLDFNNEAPSYQIMPMIFIPFIENAFKHSNIENTEKGWIHISLNNKIDEIIFQVDNSVSHEGLSQDDVGGIGLENVKRRLELVYGENFDLIINDNLNSYSIVLRIQKK